MVRITGDGAPPSVERGGHCRDTRPAGPVTPEAERRARDDVRARLAHRRPDIPSGLLTAAVVEEFEHFAQAPLRHYVPVLAFKRALRRLARQFPEPDGRGDRP
ncbi:three-helix bundle dimerization domain-containing protein [Streptomyces sp. NPDC007264]|uniref:three-helix bundle dimerization domain-containing protein n=1 Tax=Streptomyces sp. NPDC007264 TaxID=3364777 RepID=UPI0036DE414C